MQFTKRNSKFSLSGKYSFAKVSKNLVRYGTMLQKFLTS